MNRSASASANGAQTREENGVPWQNTTGGPDPARAQAIRRPSHVEGLGQLHAEIHGARPGER